MFMFTVCLLVIGNCMAIFSFSYCNCYFYGW